MLQHPSLLLKQHKRGRNPPTFPEGHFSSETLSHTSYPTPPFSSGSSSLVIGHRHQLHKASQPTIRIISSVALTWTRLPDPVFLVWIGETKYDKQRPYQQWYKFVTHDGIALQIVGWNLACPCPPYIAPRTARECFVNDLLEMNGRIATSSRNFSKFLLWTLWLLRESGHPSLGTARVPPDRKDFAIDSNKVSGSIQCAAVAQMARSACSNLVYASSPSFLEIQALD